MMDIVIVESFAKAILKSQKMEYFNAKYLYLTVILRGINLQLNTKNT